jgi:hypothetical protein
VAEITGTLIALKVTVDMLARRAGITADTAVTLTQDMLDATERELQALHELKHPSRISLRRRNTDVPPSDFTQLRARNGSFTPTNAAAFDDYLTWVDQQVCKHCGKKASERPRDASGRPLDRWITEDDCGCTLEGWR